MSTILLPFSRFPVVLDPLIASSSTMCSVGHLSPSMMDYGLIGTGTTNNRPQNTFELPEYFQNIGCNDVLFALSLKRPLPLCQTGQGKNHTVRRCIFGFLRCFRSYTNGNDLGSMKDRTFYQSHLSLRLNDLISLSSRTSSTWTCLRACLRTAQTTRPGWR